MPRVTEIAAFVGGFVAGEGCFTRSAAPGHFAFSVGLGATDAATCELVAAFLGVGHLTRTARRRSHYDDEVTFQVRKLADLVNVVVPFMDEHLPPSYKRTQYERWRAELLTYWEHAARRRRPCTVEGCGPTDCAAGTSTRPEASDAAYRFTASGSSSQSTRGASAHSRSRS